MSTQSLVHSAEEDLLLNISSIFVSMADSHLKKTRFLVGDGFCQNEFLILCNLEEILKSSNCEIRNLLPEYSEKLNLIILKYK